VSDCKSARGSAHIQSGGIDGAGEVDSGPCALSDLSSVPTRGLGGAVSICKR
jgi:hypothetical protein